MSAIDQPIKLGVPIREAVAWIGIFASRVGTREGDEAAGLCAELAASFGDHAEATVQIPAIAVLCSLCDAFRESGSDEAVALAERIVALLKTRNRVIVGRINYHTNNLASLDATLEQIRRKAGG